MAHDCKNCKFHNFDYEWDDILEEEVEIEVCEKRRGLLLHLPFKCPYFEKHKPKPYIEQFTECDKCEYVNRCIGAVEITTYHDMHRHFTRGRNAYCRKESGAFEDKKLSEIIELMEKKNDPYLQSDRSKKILRNVIKQFGDITYRELMEEKLYKMELLAERRK